MAFRIHAKVTIDMVFSLVLFNEMVFRLGSTPFQWIRLYWRLLTHEADKRSLTVYEEFDSRVI